MPNIGKRDGELAEIQFLRRAWERGITVCKPFGDSNRYDYVTECKGVLARVQIKSTHVKEHRRDRYSVKVAHGNRSKKHYSTKDCDYVACWVAPLDTWYVIPITALEGVNVSLYPHRESRSDAGKYERFKEAWTLLIQSQTPHGEYR